MLTSDAECDQLLAEAGRLSVTGWDFTVLGDRLHSSEPELEYDALVAAQARVRSSMLDLGTDGGEWLAKLAARPPRTATESWPPNVTIARRRPASLGIDVVAAVAAPDNVRLGEQPAPPLPFADGAFDLICARHESFVPDEVARVLTPGGSFITQRVADEPFGLYRALLGLEPGLDRDGHRSWPPPSCGKRA